MLVGQGACHAEASVHEVVGEVDRTAIAEFLLQVGIERGDTGAHVKVIHIEAGHGLDLDISTDAVSIHVRQERLVDHDAGQHVCVDDIEADLTVFGFRRGQADTIDRGRDQVGIKTADRDEAAFALVVEDVDTHRAAGRFGDVLVRELANGVRRQNGDIAVIGALARQGGVERAALAHHQDIVDISDIVTERDGR